MIVCVYHLNGPITEIGSYDLDVGHLWAKTVTVTDSCTLKQYLSVVPHLVLAICVVDGEWVAMVVVSAWHLVL